VDTGQCAALAEVKEIAIIKKVREKKCYQNLWSRLQIPYSEIVSLYRNYLFQRLAIFQIILTS